MLSGVRIIEIEGLGPGPFAAMLLADLGADVITIHRAKPPQPMPPTPSLLDRGKRSIVLDLKCDTDRAHARALIQTADALIEGFRPGVMERLGLGPADCHAVAPHLVYGRITGWGQDGPRAQTAGHDMNYAATAGALWYASPAGTLPEAPATLLGDVGGGALYLVIGLLAGILKARETGRGTVVDAAIVDGSAHMMGLLMALNEAGHLRETRGQSLLDGPHWSRTYRCLDGGVLSVQCLEPQFYAEFLACLDLGDHPAFKAPYDPQTWPNAANVLADIFAKHPRAYWKKIFDGTDACVAPVLSPNASAQDPHMRTRHTWEEVAGTLQAAPAPRFDGQRAPIRSAPKRDADREAILAEIAD